MMRHSKFLLTLYDLRLTQGLLFQRFLKCRHGSRSNVIRRLRHALCGLQTADKTPPDYIRATAHGK